MTVAVQDDTRCRVLEVALELIAEQGFAGTSTREVCERIGFTKAALYYHFKAKEDLLAALMAPVLEALTDLTERVTVQPGPTARRQVASAYVDLVLAHEDLMRVLYDDPSARNQPPMAAVQPLYARLFQLLAGTDTPDTCSLARARAATGAVHAVLLRGDAAEDRQVLRTVAVTAACGALGVPCSKMQKDRPAGTRPLAQARR